MVDKLQGPSNSPETDDQATIAEWARKHYLRNGMREDALPADEFKLLDKRLIQWTADRQREGKLPPDWALDSKWSALAAQFLNSRDEAKPIFTKEEQRDVDASCAASELRDRIDDKHDVGPSLRQVATRYAAIDSLGEFEARQRVTDRFAELYGRAASEYAKEQKAGQRTGSEQRDQRVLPPELGWEKYEPAFRRWATFNSMQYVAKRDGTISPREYGERQDDLRHWVRDQRLQGKLPTESEIRGKQLRLDELMLPFQKRVTRQEKQRMRSDGAYWRRMEDFANDIKGNIETERRYTRLLNDCVIAGAAAYGKSLDQVKEDIQDRFARRYLYSPSEYYEQRVERGDRDHPQRPDRETDAPERQRDKSSPGKGHDDDRGR